MIINPNTIDIFNILIDDSEVCDSSKYLYNNMIKYVKADNLFFKELYSKNCDVKILNDLSINLKILEGIIKDLTSNVSFIKLDYSVKRIIYMFSIIEIYLMENIPDTYYKLFKQREIDLENIDFDKIKIDELDTLFEHIYLKYNLIKKINEESGLEGLIRLELINKKLIKLGHENLFDLYLSNKLNLDYIVTITGNEADIHRYKSGFLADFILKKGKIYKEKIF